MTAFVEDRARVAGTPEAIWSVIEDPAALARVLPGAETIESTGPGAFRGVLASRIQFLTVRADVEASFHDADPPRHLRLRLDGRPRGIAGSFTASIPFDLEPIEAEPGATEVRYAIDMTVSGRLATFGAPLMRDTLRRQVAALVRNLDAELAARAAADG